MVSVISTEISVVVLIIDQTFANNFVVASDFIGGAVGSPLAFKPA